MAKQYYYRCDSASEIGKRLRKLLNECQKAERAQMDFGRKCGAESIVPVDGAFEGGVVGVMFKDDDQVNRTVWKEVVKDKDGKIIWRPNCEHREGAVVAKSERYRPSNTATRIYRYGQVGWEVVKHLFQGAGGKGAGGNVGEMHGKNAGNDHGMHENKQYILYTELYRDDTKKTVRDMNKMQREAISLERERMMLPVVTPQRVFATLQADMMAGAKEEESVRIIQPETPTFWEYGSCWYIGCVFPCKAEGLKEISSQAYVSKRTDLLRVQRDMEALARSEEKGS